MFDIKTVPPFVVKEMVMGDFSIQKKGNTYHLYQGESQWMQLNIKTNMEVKELYSSYDLAYGDVLLTGFGFGILPLWLASKPGVKSVTVLEKNKEIVDIFLKNNTLPDTVKIIFTDAKTYTSGKDYDCLLLDHFADHVAFPYEEVRQIAKNISNHNLLWYWSLETRYVEKYYDLDAYKLYVAPVSFKDYDFSTYLDEYLSYVDIPTVPKVSTDKLREYIDTYFNRIALLGL